MTHMLEGRLKGAMEEAEKEKALKEVSKTNLQGLGEALEAVERRVVEAKKACALAEQQVVDLEGKLGEAEMRLA